RGGSVRDSVSADASAGAAVALGAGAAVATGAGAVGDASACMLRSIGAHPANRINTAPIRAPAIDRLATRV
ncbi:MAG: hypothetical protein ABI633_13210, partial [Burkholderiales bacterium]